MIEQKAKELIDRFMPITNKIGESSVSSKTYAKQCALISIENEYHSLREQLYNLKSCGLIENNKVYLARMLNLTKEENQIKSFIENNY